MGRTTKLALPQESRQTWVRHDALHISNTVCAYRHVADVQYAFGLTYPTPGTFYTTGGRPPYIPDALETTNDNEPYMQASSQVYAPSHASHLFPWQWLEYVLALDDEELPQAISNSYTDNEQTGAPPQCPLERSFALKRLRSPVQLRQARVRRVRAARYALIPCFELGCLSRANS